MLRPPQTTPVAKVPEGTAAGALESRAGLQGGVEEHVVGVSPIAPPPSQQVVPGHHASSSKVATVNPVPAIDLMPVGRLAWLNSRSGPPGQDEQRGAPKRVGSLEKELEQVRDKAAAVKVENYRFVNQLKRREDALWKHMMQEKSVTGAGNQAGPAVLVHADRLSAPAKLQEGVPMSCGVTGRANLLENAPTGPIFSLDPSVLVHADRGMEGTKPQEGGAKLQEGAQIAAVRCQLQTHRLRASREQKFKFPQMVVRLHKQDCKRDQ